MLSSFFNKSKPINFVFIGLYMILVYTMAHYLANANFQNTSILLSIAGLLVYLATPLVLFNVLQRNELTRPNSYALFLFAFFSATIPTGLIAVDVLLANLFIMLALRSLLSLRNEKRTKSKIFDASILIALATFTYFWSILFFALIYLAIAFFARRNYRHWIIPIVGFATVYILTTCLYLLFQDTLIPHNEYITQLSIDFSGYQNPRSIFSVGVLMISGVFFLFVYMARFRRKPALVKSVLRLIIAQLIIGICVVVLSAKREISELYFLVCPLALISTTYFETDLNDIVKEINIWVLFILPFLLLLF
ncbi:DUF6427 family protein [Aquimarina brevivitae]|uniref:Uncharacterized protein n=1 Tax=Aquimarina brevivitae TaxID=323412 RepID=A0A4Q7PFM7_9FLAO|nr:DUF6427 family protein [Aquimarina brevivitae]RZS99271.1 hypothetical protein EV197_0480 [Aquimarina brevivitae]